MSTATATHPQSGQGGVSAEEASLDQLIQEASLPTLSTLFKRAKDAGVIKPVTVYGEGAASPPPF